MECEDCADTRTATKGKGRGRRGRTRHRVLDETETLPASRDAAWVLQICRVAGKESCVCLLLTHRSLLGLACCAPPGPRLAFHSPGRPRAPPNRPTIPSPLCSGIFLPFRPTLLSSLSSSRTVWQGKGSGFGLRPYEEETRHPSAGPTWGNEWFWGTAIAYGPPPRVQSPNHSSTAGVLQSSPPPNRPPPPIRRALPLNPPPLPPELSLLDRSPTHTHTSPPTRRHDTASSLWPSCRVA